MTRIIERERRISKGWGRRTPFSDTILFAKKENSSRLEKLVSTTGTVSKKCPSSENAHKFSVNWSISV
jgi:hypothetical protein